MKNPKSQSKSKAKSAGTPAGEMQSNPRPISRKQCPHCVSGPETYGYLKRGWVYDVDLARKIVSDGREPVEMENDDVEYCVDNSRIHEEHLDHVDTRFPGILAHLWGPGENGAWEHGHLLIDGNHRAARCLRDGKTFRAYLLTEDESEAILLRGTDRNGKARTY